MIEGLKPYPEYKDSGLQWIAEIPTNWRIIRNGSLFRQRIETGYITLPILEVSIIRGVTIRDFQASSRKQVMSDTGMYKRTMRGDIAYNMMRMWQGAVGVTPVDGLVSPAYVVAKPYPNVDPRYFVSLFKTSDYKAEIESCSRGIVADRNRLYWDQFKQIQSPLPPPDEQAAIVKFLDYANAKIERAIRAKRKQLSLVRELLIATTQSAMQSSVASSVNISQAVDVKCRQVVRDANHKYVTVGLFNRGRGLFHKSPLRGDALGDSEFYWIDDGDLIISGQFAWEGAVALAGLNDSKCIASHRFPILRGRENVVSSAVLFALLRTSPQSSMLLRRSF